MNIYLTKKAILAIMTVMVSFMLVGCSMEATPDTAESEPEAVVTVEFPMPDEVETEVPGEADTKPAQPAPSEEITSEPAEESTPAPITYEGIDMESSLPGKEWIKTFEGIIEEPKLVVFNDTTNKKIILENNQEVEFAADDIMAIYMPENTVLIEPDRYIFLSTLL